MKELKLVYSHIIPFKGYYAMMLFGKLVRRYKYKNTPVPLYTMNHESIHVCQAKDFCPGVFGYLIFYILYFLEWLLKLLPCAIKNKSPYRSISFEQEAFEHSKELAYINIRDRFNWKQYIFKLV